MSKYYLGERAARAVRRLMHGGSSVGTVPGATGEPVDVQEYAVPWTVQWASSEGDSGSWIIWLTPVGSVCDSSGQLTSAYDSMYDQLDDAENHAGWKILPVTISSVGALWLNIVRGEDDEASMTISTSTETGAISIPIARVERNTVSGAVKIYQLLDGELVLGSESSDPGVSPDGKSIDKSGANNSLELLSFQTALAETDTLVKAMTDGYSGAKELVERNNVGNGGNTVKYRKVGKLYGGSDSNVVFTNDGQGGVKIDVYYK